MGFIWGSEGLYGENEKDNGSYCVATAVFAGQCSSASVWPRQHLRGRRRRSRGYMGLYRDNGKEKGNYRNYRDDMGIIGLHWGYIGIMENRMETTI